MLGRGSFACSLVLNHLIGQNHITQIGHPGKLLLDTLQKKCKILVSAKGIHTSVALCQEKKLSVLDETNNGSCESKQFDKNKVDSEVSDVIKKDSKVIQRIKPPLTKPEPEEYRLPYHDEKRVTSEQRNFDLKSEIMFDDLAVKLGATKQTFLLTINKYIAKETLYRRGAVEFVYAGLREMDKFGVERDLSAYKALLKVFPEGKMIPRNAWQVEFMHYPRQQQCVIDMLEQMEHKGVIPDREYGRILRDRFGNEAHVTRKYRRIRYWLPKFKNMNPYPVPFELPTDAIQLALVALKRMTVDNKTEFAVWRTADLQSKSEEDTFIASAQSLTQKMLLDKHDVEEPLFVEGPFPVYLKYVRQNYFILRAEPNVKGLIKQKEWQKKEEDEENLFEWSNFFEDENYSQLQPAVSVHEQEDSTILALCITGTSSKDSVVQWIRCLERDNPKLSKVPVLFQLLSSESEVQVVGDSRKFKDHDKS